MWVQPGLPATRRLRSEWQRITYRPLLATLIAHGTNLGLAAMSHSVDSVTAEQLQDVNRWFLRDATAQSRQHDPGRLSPSAASEPGLG